MNFDLEIIVAVAVVIVVVITIVIRIFGSRSVLNDENVIWINLDSVTNRQNSIHWVEWQCRDQLSERRDAEYTAQFNCIEFSLSPDPVNRANA